MTHELAWAAGLFDGEGHVGCSIKNDKSKSYQMHLSVAQVHRGVLDRFAAAVGIGRVYTNKYQSSAYKTIYRYGVSNFEGVQAVVASLWKWLSPVKREQAKAALARFHEAHAGLYGGASRWKTRRAKAVPLDPGQSGAYPGAMQPIQ